MLDAERETVRTLGRNPWLFVAGSVAAVAWLVAQVVVAVPVMLVTLPRNTQPVFALPLAGLVSVVALPPALAGLYAAIRKTRADDGRGEDDERDENDGRGGGGGRIGLVGTLRLFLGGFRRYARDLVVATIAFRLVALVPAVAVFVLLLAGDTAVAYWQYAAGNGVSRGIASLVFVWLYATVAGAVGRLTFAFYDLPVLFAGVSPTKGWRAALRFTRRRPRALLRYGAGRVLLWAPMLAVLVLELDVLVGGGSPLEATSTLALFLGASLVVGTVTTTLVAAHHVVVYERAVEPVLREPTATRSGTPSDSIAGTQPDSPAVATPGGAGGGDASSGGSGKRRLAVAALAVLLVTAAAGTAAVRITDTRPMPGADARPVDDAAAGDEVIHDAEALLASASYRSRATSYRINDTTGERQPVLVTRVAVDRRNRRGRVSGRVRTGEDADDWSRTAYYASDATLAMNLPGDGQPSGAVALRERFVGRTAGEWGVMYVPGYARIVSGAGTDFRDDGDWQVVERTDERVVVGYAERSDEDSPEDGEVLAVEQVRLTVDRETGRPERFTENRTFVEYENGTAVERRHGVDETTYSDYGEPNVERPDAIGTRGPIEWAWDIVNY